MHLVEVSNAATFLQRTRQLLLAAEAQNNLLLSSTLTLARSTVAGGSTRLSFFLVEKDEKVLCAAINAGERRLLLSTAPPDAASFMARELRKRNTPIKAVLGPSPEAEAFCSELGDGKLKQHQIQRVLRLESRQLRKLDGHEMAQGLCRQAKEKDLRLLLQWSENFVDECGIDESREETAEVVRRYLENRQLFIWENRRPFAMAGFGGITPNGVRVSMVYTEQAARARGYARSLVHVLSRKLLSQPGRKFCYLFVDAANPAANKVYERLGYEPVGAFTDYRSAL
jgi:predicted GNAT family acetyltransferase